MNITQLRCWWWWRQGLDGTLKGKSAAQALQQSGWARSVGSANPYLAIYSRTGLSRQDIDESAGRLDIHELPSARGCTSGIVETCTTAVGAATGAVAGLVGITPAAGFVSIGSSILIGALTTVACFIAARTSGGDGRMCSLTLCSLNMAAAIEPAPSQRVIVRFRSRIASRVIVAVPSTERSRTVVLTGP